MQLKSMEDLFLHELRDLHSAEKQLTQALPKMAKKTEHPELRKAFETHLKQTEEHISRLETILEGMDKSPRGEKCKGMAGLIEEANGAMEDAKDPAVLDAALIGAAQRVEHYEMAGYGTARTYASMMGNKKAAQLLEKTLEEEKATDANLTKLAEGMVNWDAFKA